MPKTTHTAICPDGAIHRRQTARTYTHTVVGQYNYAQELANAQEYTDPNYAHYAAYLDGTSKWLVKRSYVSEEAHAVADARKQIGSATCKAEFVANKRAEAVARVEARKAAGYYDVWVNLGWCGRRDLAEKLAAKGRHYCHNVTILEAK